MATQQVVTSSKRFSLSLNDFWRGLIMAIGGAVFQIVVDTIQQGSLTFDWKKIGTAALGAAVVYLSKNFFQTPKIVVTNPTEKQVTDVKDGDATVKVIPS